MKQGRGVEVGGGRRCEGGGKGKVWFVPAKVSRTVLLVQGMKDNRCRETVAEALEAVEGVSEVEVNLYRGRAVVVHALTCDPEDLARAVKDLGYWAIPEAG